MGDNKLEDGSSDKKYFMITPQLVWAVCRSPYDYTLWNVIKMVAGEEGECYLSTEDLAILAMMSAGKVSQCRKYLIKEGLLAGHIRRDPGYPQPVWHLQVPDLWEKNVTWRQSFDSLADRIELKKEQKKSLHQMKASPGEEPPSPDEGGVSPGEEPPSPDETKKNQEEEPPKNEKEDPLYLPDSEIQLDVLFPENANGIEQQLTDLKAANWQPGEMLGIGLAHYFKATKQMIPSNKDVRGDYEKEVSEHLTDYGASVLAWLYPDTVKKMRANNWNISRPGSLTKTMRDVYGAHQDRDWLTPTPPADIQARLDAGPPDELQEWWNAQLPLVTFQFPALRKSVLVERENGSLQIQLVARDRNAVAHAERNRASIAKALGVQEIEFVEG